MSDERPVRIPADERARARALIYLVLSAVSFGIMAFAAQLATARLSGPQVAAVRFVIMLVPVALLPNLWRRAVTVYRVDLLLYRGVFGGLAVLLYFLTIEHTSAGVATLLNYLSPIWSVLFAAWFLGEETRARLVFPLLGALGGAALVLSDQARVFAGGWKAVGPWALAGIASAILSGAAVTAIRAARRTETSWAIYGSFSLFGLLSTLPFAWSGWLAPTSREWLLLLAVGVSSIAAQMLMTHAYRWATNLEAGVIVQIAVVISMGLGVGFLGDPFGAATLVGSVIAIGSVLAVVWMQRPPRAVE